MNYLQYNCQVSATVNASTQPVIGQPAAMVQPYTNTNQQTIQLMPHQNNPNRIMSGFRTPILSANGYTPLSPGQIQHTPVLRSSVNEVPHPLVLGIAQDEAATEDLSLPSFDVLIQRPVDNGNNFWISSNILTPPPSPASGNSSKATRQQRTRNKDGPKRARTTYTADDVAVLEKAYVENPRITRMQRIDLSEKLQKPESTIRIWFQNRRIKSKRERLCNLRNGVGPDHSVASSSSTAAVENQAQQRPAVVTMNPAQQRPVVGNMNQRQQIAPVVKITQGQQHTPVVNQGQQHAPVGNGAAPTVNNYYDSDLDQFLGGNNQGGVEITAQVTPLS